MRDFLFIIAILASLPAGVFYPYYGILVYTWVTYMYPHLLTWSFQNLPVAKWTAMAVLAGTVARGAINTAPLRTRETFLMMLLWCTFTLSTLFALNPVPAWDKWKDVSKLIVMAVVTSMLLTDQKRMRYFLLVVGLSLGFYGFKGGLFSLANGGELSVWGPSPSLLYGNNNIGLALNMALPFLWYLAHGEKGYLKAVLYAMFFLTIPAIMFTYSRASALTMPLILLAIMCKGRNRALLISVLCAGALIAVPLIPDKFWDRQQTVLTYESDGSAMSRIDNWKFCWTVALDRPITGGGFEFYSRNTFARYAPQFLFTYGGRTWDTHNIYFAMLGSHGFPGLLVFVSMIVACFVSCSQMEARARRRTDLGWVTSYSSLVQVSFLALLVNGMFVNMEYFDLVYHLVAVVATLRIISRHAFSETKNEEPGSTHEWAATATAS
jgi:putative inorganic carbon (HCO3(-)) transporter